jgi:predicted esterase
MRHVNAVLLFLCIAAAAATADTQVTGRLVEGIACASDPTQTYTLYLPSAYDAETKWPVLLVLDPRGRSVVAANLFREAAEEHGWIIMSSNDTRSDTSMDPNIRAVNAMLPELGNRYAVDGRRIYAAGFSGTMVTAFMIGHSIDGFGGAIAAGGRYFPDLLEGADFPFFGAVGTTDFNFQEMRRVDDRLAKLDAPHRLEVFDGPHTWMPEEMAGEAVLWMEIMAMGRGLRPRNDAVIREAFLKEMAAADELEASGRTLDALRRYESIVRTFEGLWDVGRALGSAKELTASGRYKKARKEQRRWDTFESRTDDEFARAVTALENSNRPPSAESFADQINLGELLRRSERDGLEGETVQRILNHFYAMTSFYMARDFIAQKRYDHADTSLTIAARIREHPVVWYNVACVRAQSGRPKPALDALERAVELGFDDFELMETDADLQSLRDTERYAALIGDR